MSKKKKKESLANVKVPELCHVANLLLKYIQKQFHS